MRPLQPWVGAQVFVMVHARDPAALLDLCHEARRRLGVMVEAEDPGCQPSLSGLLWFPTAMLNFPTAMLRLPVATTTII